MLTKAIAADLMRQGELKISYEFDPRESPPVSLETKKTVDPDDREIAATLAFESAYFGDRFGVTLGPLVMSHDYRRKHGRVNYRHMESVFDLSEADYKIDLSPGESITVNTIENIALGGNVAALTLPRLSHATAGLALTTSYIDPYWQGILALHLVNVTSHRIQLKVGERIAIVRFYEIVGGPLPPETAARFAEKSHHYGLSWERVLNSDADPFPLRKQWSPSLLPKSVTTGARRTLRAASLLGITAAVLIGGIFYLGRAADRVERIPELEQKVHKSLSQNEVLKEQIRELEREPRSVRPSG